MATLPRSSTKPTASTLARHLSEFDAGINTSHAWTEHLDRESDSLSDEEPEINGADDGDDQDENRPARALYDFEGKPEFRELTIAAGEEILVIKEGLADGWSLIKNETGELGLLPRTYYAFTSQFVFAPGLPTRPRTNTMLSSGSVTPRGSPKWGPVTLPITPQTTGERRRAFPSIRQSLLGGKSLNRFSNFVTSGAEEWVLKGSPVEPVISVAPMHDRETSEDLAAYEEVQARLSKLGMGEADKHFVDAGPVWKPKLPPFHVLVHSPIKATPALSGAYTVYSVTSLFHTPAPSTDANYAESTLPPPSSSPTRITVYRRFSHFVILHTALTRRLPGIALPPLPEKQYAGRFSSEFVEARRSDLERYIGRVVRHPIARYAEIVTFFLGCDSDIEWKRLAPQHLKLPPAGPLFYAQVFHPAFNIDPEEAADTLGRFDTHTRAVGKGVQALRNIFGKLREARIEMSKAERLLSYSLLSLITSKPLTAAPTTGVNEEDGTYNVQSRGLLNDEGAWCWRERCEACLKLTKAMQKTAETLQIVADLYDDHARRTLFATHESLKGVAHPYSLYQPVMDTHRSTLSRYNAATLDDRANEDMAARCETVLNTTMAEMETYHTQKIEDFGAIAKEHLDGEIAFYQQVLGKLRTVRRVYDMPQYRELGQSPRQPSIYERELENPRIGGGPPIPQPCPHVFDSAPMRPVSVAIQEGVGMLLGGANSGGRASVFSKFW